MRTNPFRQSGAPAWLAEGPIQQVPRLLETLLEVAEYVPDLYEILPWLKGMDAWGLIQERHARLIFRDAPPSAQETTLTTFFANVTGPVAERIGTLYASPLLRHTSTVEEIVRRMAHSMGRPALPLDVVIGVCCSFWRSRASYLKRDRIQAQETTWCLGWQQTAVQVRTTQQTHMPYLLLVTNETAGTILAFRSTQGPPTSADILLTLVDALVFPDLDWRPHQASRPLSLPAHLHVQRPVPPEMVEAGKFWEIEVEEVEPHAFAFVHQWEHDLSGRVLDLMQYLRIFDRACERAFGYAPLLTKQQMAQRIGWRMLLHHDPSWSRPSLRELLPTYQAVVGKDGTLLWHGWHYRDMEDDVLRYWPGEAVMIRPSPYSEATIWVYWKETLLCYATASELRHEDGSYRPYWFPYPRLGE
jgi:hypothetical protein